MLEELAKEIKENRYQYIGIRHLASDEEYKVGDTCRNSFDWDCENDTSAYAIGEPVELNGTCAYDTTIDYYWEDEDEIVAKLQKAIAESEKHYTGQVAIIAGERMECGYDDNEIIIEDAIVIGLI